MSQISRRSVIVGSAAAAMTIPAAAHATEDEVSSLWIQRQGLIDRIRQLDGEQEQAREALPWWAKPGPAYLRHDGTMDGPDSPWPAISAATPPKNPGTRKLIRINPNSGNEPDEIATLKRAMLTEEEKLGIPDREEQLEDLFGQLTDLEQRIAERSRAGSIYALAATVLLGLCQFMSGDFDDLACDDLFVVNLKAALRGFRPQLDGPLGTCVDAVLEPKVRTYSELFFVSP